MEILYLYYRGYTTLVLQHFGAPNYFKSQQIPSKKPSAEKILPQMKADHKMFHPKWKQIIFLIRPKYRQTVMMIVQLKRGGRVLSRFI